MNQNIPCIYSIIYYDNRREAARIKSKRYKYYSYFDEEKDEDNDLQIKISSKRPKNEKKEETIHLTPILPPIEKKRKKYTKRAAKMPAAKKLFAIHKEEPQFQSSQNTQATFSINPYQIVQNQDIQQRNIVSIPQIPYEESEVKQKAY